MASLTRCALLLTLAACAAAPPPPAPPPPLAPIAVIAPPAAPEPPAPPPPPPPSPLSELALITHRAFFDALRAHDAKALSGLYAPDASVSIGLGLADAHGPEAVATLAQTLFTAFPDAKTQWGRLLESGNTLAVELAWTGTHVGPLAGRAPTKRVVGTTALLVERFAPSGLIASQHLYFDADTLAADLATRVEKPHPFAGLPTRQTTVPDHTAASAEDDVAMKKLLTSFGAGSFRDALALARVAHGVQEASAWVDESNGRLGSGAVAGWVAFLARTFPGGGAKRVESWTAGDYLIEEWSASPGAPPDVTAAHAADVILFEGGHVAEVHTYRNAPHKVTRRLEP